ncbi:MAG TPA: PASTA domain-containing protein [Thermoanaerobaculia bacterium]|nr:PASTA domain-containing protein [Thermoanaerobaculia bacterium]
MARRLLRWLLVLAYLAVLATVLGLTSYASFSRFVRRGAIPAPDVVGLPFAQAESLLADAGLRPRRAEDKDRFDEEIDAGHVVHQNPGAGSFVKQGGKVEIVLSRGRQVVRVPEVTAQSLQSAQAELIAVGLTAGERIRVRWAGGAPGTVVRQQPLAGVGAAHGSAVDLLVSIDDPAATYVMPDLVYRRADPVRVALERRGFRFGSVKYESYEGVEEGVILRHTPLPGHPLRPGDSITLVVAVRDDT